MTICPHCGRDIYALAWGSPYDLMPAESYQRWVAERGGMSAQAWQDQMMRQANALAMSTPNPDSYRAWLNNRLNFAMQPYRAPVAPPKLWESGWREKQSEWEKIP